MVAVFAGAAVSDGQGVGVGMGFTRHRTAQGRICLMWELDIFFTMSRS